MTSTRADTDAYLYFGRGAKVYPTAKIVRPDRLLLDDHAVIGDFAFVNASGFVRIGKYAHLAPYVLVAGGGVVEVGNFSEISYGTKLVGGTDDILGPYLFTPGVPAEHRNVTRSEVHIGALCILGADCIVYPGVSIGDGVIVSPGTIVRSDLAAWHVYDGPACRPIGARQHREALLARAASVLAGAALEPPDAAVE